jgi:hypothetical protein
MNKTAAFNLVSIRSLLVALGAVALLIPIAHAHHSPASFDLNKSITVRGLVKKVEWFNPHVYVFIEETTSTGQKVEWEIEVLPPMALRGSGWTKETLRAGDTMVVNGNPAKSPNSKELFPRAIKLGDRTLFSFQEVLKRFTSAEPPALSKTSTTTLNGIWEPVLSMQILQQFGSPPQSRLTKEGVEAGKRFDERSSPANNCIPIPGPLWLLIPDLKRISAADGALYIEGESGGVRRTVHMNVDVHDGVIPSIQGHSIGKWEGKTLVVDTTHFAFHAIGNGVGLGTGLPSSTQRHMVERFTLSPDGKSLTYQFKVSDPVYLAVPTDGEIRWIFSPDKKFEAEKCSADSARRFLRN